MQTEKTNVANVNFNELFEDKLPDDAIELGTYVTSLKEKDSNGDEKAEAAVQKAYESLKKVENIADHTNSFYLMVTDLDIVPKSKGYEMVRRDPPRDQKRHNRRGN